MGMKRLLFIYNPWAGQQRARKQLAEILDIFAEQSYEVTVHPTQARGDAVERARRSLGFDRVVCCGGDGTFHETVAGLMALPDDQRPPLGYIPMGTTNDFARNLELPQKLADRVRVAGGEVLRRCDVGWANGQLFTYIAAFGLFTDVAYTTDQTAKNLLGHFAYVLQGAGQLVNIPSFRMRVSCPGQPDVEGEFIYGMVGNTVSVGGLVNLPREQVHLDDGQFEVILVRAPRTPRDWQTILNAFAQQTIPESGSVIGMSAGEVRFSCERMAAWTLDGEFGGACQKMEMVNQRQAILVACGR
jgi:YegS/Rv2252/BmrU family lipid kinase